ncbi:MAG: hypothetical protein LBI48_00695 [Burkholderiaceae bacterium]|jgi:hypothetical protein|nr:hypothetical protein [Burkholderiaceae bacterium]
MPQRFANAARATLAAGIGGSDTTLALEAGTGALFPPAGMSINGDNDWWLLTLQDQAGIEIVKVTDHAAGADTLTVERGQQGTPARAFAAGTVAGLRITAADAKAWAGTAERLTEPSGATVSYDPATGNVSQVTRIVNGAPMTTSYIYAGGSLSQTQTVYQGALRTVSYSYDAAGRNTGYTATEETL